MTLPQTEKDLELDKSVSAKYKIAYFLSSNKIESSLVLAFTSFLLAIGFFMGSGNNANYDLIYGFAQPFYWGALFLSYSMFKFYSIWNKTSYQFRLINSAIGIWAWNYIFLSFAVFDKSPMAPTELLLLVPIIAEIWISISSLHCKKEKV